MQGWVSWAICPLLLIVAIPEKARPELLLGFGGFIYLILTLLLLIFSIFCLPCSSISLSYLILAVHMPKCGDNTCARVPHFLQNTEWNFFFSGIDSVLVRGAIKLNCNNYNNYFIFFKWNELNYICKII